MNKPRLFDHLVGAVHAVSRANLRSASVLNGVVISTAIRRPGPSGRANGLRLPNHPIQVPSWNHLIKRAFLERAVG